MTSAISLHDVSYSPFDGSLFLPEMVEFNARHNATHPFYTFYDENLGDLRHISHLEFYRASQRVAHAVRPNRQGPDSDVVAIVANTDTILYQVLTMGIMLSGLVVRPTSPQNYWGLLISFLKPFPMSPRNSPAAVVNMMRKTGCRRLIATRHSLGSLLDGISAELRELQIEDPPTFAYAFPELGRETANTPFVPYPKAEERPSKDNVLFYLHSSGSTGFPKPIPITNITAVHWCMMRECSVFHVSVDLIHSKSASIQAYINLPKHITICGASLPAFHMMGTVVQLIYPVASLKSIAVYPPTSYQDSMKAPIIANSQNVIEVVQATKSDLVFVVPAFLEEWATSTQAVDVLCSLDCVVRICVVPLLSVVD